MKLNTKQGGKVFEKDKGGWSWHETKWNYFHFWRWGFGFGEGKKWIELQVNHPHFILILSIPFIRFEIRKFL